MCTQSRDFTKISSFFKSFDTSYVQFAVITRLTDEKCLEVFQRGCNSSEVGSVKTYVEKINTSWVFIRISFAVAKTSVFIRL